MCENWFHVAKLYKKYQTGYYDTMKFAFPHLTTPQKQDLSDNAPRLHYKKMAASVFMTACDHYHYD